MVRITVDIVYDDARFDPRPTRWILGLDGNRIPGKLIPEEKLRLANLLRRTGNLNDNDLMFLGMRVVEVKRE